MTTTPIIHNGTFTVTSPSGEHRTFRVRTWTHKSDDRTGAPIRSLDLLIGQDNTSDFIGIAFVSDDGAIRVWKKHRGTQYERLAASFENLMRDPERSTLRSRGMTVDEARCCQRCNRLLTTPESIASGYGPVCDGRG